MAMDVGAWQRHLLVLVVPVTTLLVIPSALDPVGLPKLVAGAAIALALTALSVLRYVERRWVARVPLGPPLWAAAGFLAAVLIASAIANFQGTAVLGQYGRYSGLILYTSAAVIFLHIVAVAEVGLLRRTAAAIGITGVVLISIGTLQALGVSLPSLTSPSGPLTGTVANPNFYSATLGIMTPFAVGIALDSRAAPYARAGGFVLALAALGLAALSGSFQGVLAAGAGLAAFGLVQLVGRSGSTARIGRLVLAVATAGGVVTVALGLAGVGPVAAIVGSRSVQFRLWYWEAALDMFRHRPFLGVGMDQYGGFFRRFRSLEAFQSGGVVDAVDAVHNVPLSMFANGGVVLGIAYLVVLAVVLWAAGFGLRRAPDTDRILLGSFVGGWVAYQIQSILSIDVPSLTFLHWLLAGAVIGLAAPWRTATAVTRRGRARGGRARRRRGGRAMDAVVARALVGVLVLSGLWGLSRPLRADVAAGQGLRLVGNGQAEAGMRKLERAVELAPSQSQYHATLGEVLLRMEETDRGLEAFSGALAVEPRDFPYTVTTARLSAAVGRHEEAADLYNRAVHLEPNSVEIAVEAAEFFLTELGDRERARQFVEQALRLSPTDESARALDQRIRG